jgi:hypothetical protein
MEIGFFKRKGHKLLENKIIVQIEIAKRRANWEG